MTVSYQPDNKLMVLVLAVSGLVRAGEVHWLQYRTAREPRRVLGEYLGGCSVEVSAQKPKRVKLPEFISDRALFAKWTTPMVKAGFLWIALDRSRKNGPYEVLYIDADGDNSLSDETPLRAWWSQGQQARFGPVALLFDGTDGPVTYHLNATFYSYRDHVRLYVNPGCWYEGTVDLDGTETRCVLADRNVNGTFNDAWLSTTR